jgi:pimeloyl-ACP methyl ester carboxylesterase
VTLPSIAEHTAALAPRGELLIYDGIGHMPFWETPALFNRDLAVFARKCQAMR